MDKKVIDNLIDEIRKEKFIPFYYEDSSIRNNIREGNYRLTKLVGTIDYDEDLTARALLKTMCFTHIIVEQMNSLKITVMRFCRGKWTKFL